MTEGNLLLEAATCFEGGRCPLGEGGRGGVIVKSKPYFLSGNVWVLVCS